MTIRIAVVGAGQIGLRHIAAIGIADGVSLSAVVDPSEAARTTAAAANVPWYPDQGAFLAVGGTDGVILATPNQLHATGALACIAAGLPVLVEKPLTATAAEGRAVVEAGRKAGVAVLTGHHRRHNPLMTKAKEIVDSCQLGTLTAVQGQTWFRKPDDYFNVGWRVQPGGGPVYLNLSHDVDLLQYLCGPVAEVHAMESNAVRGNAVEETAVILLRFASGLLGTVNVCDSASAPWSWELTARENPAYPATDQSCYQIAGTSGALSLPDLTLWQHRGSESWWAPITATRMPHAFSDPLVRQIEHFAAVIRSEAEPLVSGADGLAALEVIEAVKRSAASGRTIGIA